MKITERGYWVSKCYTWISLVHWFCYSIYFRTLTYFSAANPQIYLGGMLDDRKSDIYDQVPQQYVPVTRLFVPKDTSIIAEILQEFSFPMMAKPNVGFRGYLVRRIDNELELSEVIKQYIGKELLIQEFLAQEHEYSVMYYWVDAYDHGISSLVEKHLPKVIGDGKRTVSSLIEALDNPFLNHEWVTKKNKQHLDRILDDGEALLIDHVGNFARGSKFENLNSKIDATLTTSMRTFFTHVPGMNFCRLDVKAASLNELKKGNFKLLEINGAKSEPLHIYDPRMSMWDVFRAIRTHWKTLFRIVRRNIAAVEIPSS
ncbi:MAG: hypothetical protein AAFR14_04750, partial [Bacteroidota bacterium]